MKSPWFVSRRARVGSSSTNHPQARIVRQRCAQAPGHLATTGLVFERAGVDVDADREVEDDRGIAGAGLLVDFEALPMDAAPSLVLPTRPDALEGHAVGIRVADLLYEEDRFGWRAEELGEQLQLPLSVVRIELDPRRHAMSVELPVPGGLGVPGIYYPRGRFAVDVQVALRRAG